MSEPYPASQQPPCLGAVIGPPRSSSFSACSISWSSRGLVARRCRARPRSGWSRLLQPVAPIGSWSDFTTSASCRKSPTKTGPSVVQSQRAPTVVVLPQHGGHVAGGLPGRARTWRRPGRPVESSPSDSWSSTPVAWASPVSMWASPSEWLEAPPWLVAVAPPSRSASASASWSLSAWLSDSLPVARCECGPERHPRCGASWSPGELLVVVGDVGRQADRSVAIGVGSATLGVVVGLVAGGLVVAGVLQSRCGPRRPGRPSHHPMSPVRGPSPRGQASPVSTASWHSRRGPTLVAGGPFPVWARHPRCGASWSPVTTPGRCGSRRHPVVAGCMPKFASPSASASASLGVVVTRCRWPRSRRCWRRRRRWTRWRSGRSATTSSMATAVAPEDRSLHRKEHQHRHEGGDQCHRHGEKNGRQHDQRQHVRRNSCSSVRAGADEGCSEAPSQSSTFCATALSGASATLALPAVRRPGPRPGWRPDLDSSGPAPTGSPCSARSAWLPWPPGVGVAGAARPGAGAWSGAGDGAWASVPASTPGVTGWPTAMTRPKRTATRGRSQCRDPAARDNNLGSSLPRDITSSSSSGPGPGPVKRPHGEPWPSHVHSSEEADDRPGGLKARPSHRQFRWNRQGGGSRRSATQRRDGLGQRHLPRMRSTSLLRDGGKALASR